jgi:hypothetical protein
VAPEPGLNGEGGTLKSAQTRSPQQSALVAQGPLVAEQLAHFPLTQLRPMQSKSLAHPASEPLRQVNSPTRKPVDWMQLPPQQSRSLWQPGLLGNRHPQFLFTQMVPQQSASPSHLVTVGSQQAPV